MMTSQWVDLTSACALRSLYKSARRSVSFTSQMAVTERANQSPGALCAYWVSGHFAMALLWSLWALPHRNREKERQLRESGIFLISSIAPSDWGERLQIVIPSGEASRFVLLRRRRDLPLSLGDCVHPWWHPVGPTPIVGASGRCRRLVGCQQQPLRSPSPAPSRCRSLRFDATFTGVPSLF